MKTIPLTQGKFALVDDEDFELVSRYKWCIHKGRGPLYAKTGIRKPGGRQTTMSMHRLLLNPAPDQLIDHINHNGLDNRRSNLRICTRIQNLWNNRRSPGPSRYRGVYWHKRAKCWEAQIRIDGKVTHLGNFKDENMAALAYDKAALLHRGEFAWLNFPQIQAASV